MSYELKIRITTSGSENKKKKEEKKFEDFTHRFRDFLKPVFVYDPVKIREFMIEKEKILRELDLGFYERKVVELMERNVRRAQERKAFEVIGKDSFYGLWFLS